MKNIRSVSVMAKCAVLCAVLIIMACEPYVCGSNGTLISSSSGLDSGVACDQPPPQHPPLTSVYNVTDNADLELAGAISAATAVVGGTTYLFVAGRADRGVGVFSVASDGALTPVHSVADDPGRHSNSTPYSVATAVVDGNTYLLVGRTASLIYSTAATSDDEISVYSVANDGTLSLVDSIGDAEDTELSGLTSVATAVVGGNTYLFVSRTYGTGGIGVFSVGADGALTWVDSVIDDLRLVLSGTRFLTTAVVEGTTYLFASSTWDKGVNVFSVGDNGKITYRYHIVDNDDLYLDFSWSMATAAIGGVTYLFVAGIRDLGISVFSVGADGALTSVQNVPPASGDAPGAHYLKIATVGSSTYLFAAQYSADSLTVFSVADDGTLTLEQNIADDAELELGNIRSIATAVVGNATYLFTAGYRDHGVSVFWVR